MPDLHEPFLNTCHSHLLPSLAVNATATSSSDAALTAAAARSIKGVSAPGSLGCLRLCGAAAAPALFFRRQRRPCAAATQPSTAWRAIFPLSWCEPCCTNAVLW